MTQTWPTRSTECFTRQHSRCNRSQVMTMQTPRLHSTLSNWSLPAGRWPPPGSSSPSFVAQKHFGRGGFEAQVWRLLHCLQCHNFLHHHLQEKKKTTWLKKATCLSTQLGVVILPMPPSSNCETKEEITTGLSTEVRSSWDPAACTQRHSIDQHGLFYVLPLRRGIHAPVVHSARLRVSFTARQSCSRIQFASGGTDVQRFHVHTSDGTAMNGVRMSPRKGDHPSQTEDRSRQLKNAPQVQAVNKNQEVATGRKIVLSARLTSDYLKCN